MSISLLAVLLLFSGCGKELENMTIPETGSDVESPEGSGQAEGEILRLQVSDAGFSDANTGSRAIDEGLTTKFEDGDQIGLFVVNNQDEILYANVPYTKEGDTWTAKENIRTKGYPVRVFAYYPYVPDDEIIAKVDSTADNYSAFFKQYIEGLDISDQSSQEGYRKADVMACMVEVKDKEEAREAFTLTLNHMLGLVVVELPEMVKLASINCYLKGNEKFTWKVENITLPANLSGEFLTVSEGGIRSFKEETGFRYLCKYKSGENNVFFSGGFITYEEEKGYEMKSTVNAGSRKIYKVSVASFVSTAKVEYTPQVGDFYMQNGSILPSISESNKNNCIGIVYWVPTASDPLDDHNPTWLEEHSTCTHGLVVGVKEMKSGWGPFAQASGITDSDTDGIFRGYSNTQLLVDNYSTYAIVHAYNELIKNVIPPLGKTSGWYVPSVGELVELSNRSTDKVADTVNASLKELISLGDTVPELSFEAGWGYYSSGECDAYLAKGILMSNGGMIYHNKGTNTFVRLVFAF